MIAAGTSTHSDLSVSSSDDDGPARVVNTPRPPATPMSPTPQHPAPVDPFAPMRQQSAPPPSGYYNSLRQPEVAQPVIDRERLIQAAQARMTNAQRQWRKATTDLMRLDLIIRQEAKIIIDNGGKPNMEEDLSAITATMNIGV